MSKVKFESEAGATFVMRNNKKLECPFGDTCCSDFCPAFKILKSRSDFNFSKTVTKVRLHCFPHLVEFEVE